MTSPPPGPVLVVGASSGFGMALARDLASDGVPVIGAARSARPSDANFTYHQADVTDDDSVCDLMQNVQAETGTPTGLVYSVSNSAAVGHAWEVEPAEVMEVLQASFVGLIRILRHVVPAMRGAGDGSIVVVGSRAARVPVPTMAGYAAAKAAVEHYVRCAAEELRTTGVRINSIGISGDTELARRHLNLRSEILGEALSGNALPDVGDNLPCARFLLSPAARFITGQTIEARQPLWT